ncbi:MAG: hypothetical protein PHY66_08245 [Aliarcobacter sp.]|nr:hypothetical protein [Aliarcobacter sp.]MDD2887780.1 hypothetical protein [Aliarcobacter sp.]
MDNSINNNLEDNQVNVDLKNEKLKLKKELREKRLFHSILIRISFAALSLSFIFFLQQKDKSEKEELIKAFNSNAELVCSSKVVSLSNGFKFDENRENFLTNGVDIYKISRCSLK